MRKTTKSLHENKLVFLGRSFFPEQCFDFTYVDVEATCLAYILIFLWIPFGILLMFLRLLGIIIVILIVQCMPSSLRYYCGPFLVRVVFKKLMGFYVKVKGKPPPRNQYRIVVANHTHPLDPLIFLISGQFPGFKLVAAAAYKSLWDMLKAMGIWDNNTNENNGKWDSCIYTAVRNQHMFHEEFEALRLKCKNEILDWIKDENKGPLLIYPEGCVTSQRALLQYQAFVFGLGVTIVPCTLKLVHALPFNTYNLNAPLHGTLAVMLFQPWSTFTIEICEPRKQPNDMTKIEFAMSIASMTAEKLNLPNCPHINFKVKEHLLQLLNGPNPDYISVLTENGIRMMKEEMTSRNFIRFTGKNLKTISLNKEKIRLGRDVQMEMVYSVNENEQLEVSISDTIKTSMRTKRKVRSLRSRKNSRIVPSFTRAIEPESDNGVTEKHETFIRSYDDHKKMFSEEPTTAISPSLSRSSKNSSNSKESDDTFSTDPYDGSDTSERKFGDDLNDSRRRLSIARSIGKSPTSSISDKDKQQDVLIPVKSSVSMKSNRESLHTSTRIVPSLHSFGINGMNLFKRSQGDSINSITSSFDESTTGQSKIVVKVNTHSGISKHGFNLNGLEGQMNLVDELGDEPLKNTFPQDKSLHAIGELMTDINTSQTKSSGTKVLSSHKRGSMNDPPSIGHLLNSPQV